MADFERKLRMLSERGSPVGAEEMIERIEAELVGDPLVVVTKHRGGLLMTKTDEPMTTTYPGPRRRFGPAVAALVVIATIGLYLAMARDGGRPVVDQGPVAPATTAAASTSTAAPSTSTSAAPDAAPPELAGRWATEINGERWILSLTGANYTVQVAGSSGGGKISVEGNQIRFYDSFMGPGDGFYEWTIDGERLTFTELQPPDPVSARDFLTGVTFTRI